MTWGFPEALMENNNVKIAIQDQHTQVVTNYLDIDIGTTTLTAGLAIEDLIVNVTGGHGAVSGNIIDIVEAGRFYQGIILSVSVNVLTMDTPLDFAYTTSAIVRIGNHNLAVNGSVTTVIAKTTPPSGVKWDITRVMVHIEDDSAMDSGRFGGIAGLTNGVVLRMKDGTHQNIYNVKTNGELSQRSYDLTYDDKAPAGIFGLTCRTTFAGPSKHGVVIRLDGNTGDELQLLIQDDLTELTDFHIIAQGHVVLGD